MVKSVEYYSANEILKGIISQNDAVLNFIYKTYFNEIRYFVNQNNGNEEDARDVFQESLIVLYRKLKNGELQLTCSFNTYFFAVCRHIWLKELEKRKKVDISSLSEAEYKLADEEMIALVEKNTKYALFQKHFEKLEEECKKVLRLFVDNKSLKEIAVLMGYKTEKYAKKRKYLCKKNLMSKIQNDPEFKEMR